MGSVGGKVGVQRGEGKLLKDETKKLKQPGAMNARFRNSNSLLIFPNSYSSNDSIVKSMQKWNDILKLDGLTRGFAVAMTGAKRSDKDRFITAFNNQMTLKQNSEEKYRSEIDKQIKIAEQWARNHGRTGLTSIERRAIAEIVRSTRQRMIIDKIIQKDRNNGNKLFGGKIRTRKLTKADFD